MDYKKHIGDGKLPNRYWVFHYDEKFVREDDELKSTNIEEQETKNNFLGEFKTWEDAINCINKAYLPHVVVEDRITGVVYESMVIVCHCCGKYEYETIEDIKFTKDFIENRGFTFK